MISLNDMHSENISFSWSKPSNYREKFIYHACETNRKWKIGQYSIRPETAIFFRDTLYRYKEYFKMFCSVKALILQSIYTSIIIANNNDETKKCVDAAGDVRSGSE